MRRSSSIIVCALLALLAGCSQPAGTPGPATPAGPVVTTTPAAPAQELEGAPDYGVIYLLREAGGSSHLIARAAGSGKERIIALAVDTAAGTPVLSPDGSRFAFMAAVGGVSQLFVVGSDGNGLLQLTRDAGEHRYPAWSPDGREIAFMSNPELIQGCAIDGSRCDTDISVAGADGGGVRRLTGGLENDGQAVWSPDGRLLAFVREESGLHTMRPDGTALRLVAPGRQIHDVRWSPDGALLAYVSGCPGSACDKHVFIVGRDGQEPALVGRGWIVGWTPDGRLLVAGERQLDSVSVDGEQQRVLELGAHEGFSLASPTLDHMLIERQHGLCQVEQCTIDLELLALDGSGQRRPILRGAGVRSRAGLLWSADGRRLLYQNNDGRRSALGLVEVDGDAPISLGVLSADDSMLEWR